MSLMDIPETERVLAEIFRVLRPGGFLQFSISHPCFETPHRKSAQVVAFFLHARARKPP
jgi:ubiquinone/menaquinone biosynthesis C-methylase UbiE